MSNLKRKSIYISNITVKGAAFQTQVLDWLHLYQKYQHEFDLFQAFNVKDLKDPADFRKQLSFFRNSTKLRTSTLIFLPSRRISYVFNALQIYLKILKYIFKFDEILIFSRGIIGKEIALLRKIFPRKIIFYYDARGAGAEENKYSAIKGRDFSLKKYKIIADTYYLEYKTISAADKVFVVSTVLMRYFQNTYGFNDKKYVLYPCLSDSSKFFFSPLLRKNLRDKLQISNETKIYIYSGGIGAWHMSEGLFSFFSQLLKNDTNSMILFLTKDKGGIEKTLSSFPEIREKYLLFSVSNDEVNDYLNAADYGILFRENTIMNNVASPTKFAEYMLSGLPVLISEGIGDYSDFAMKNGLGVLIKESELKDPETFDLNKINGTSFDRQYIAEIGRTKFSKDSARDYILTELKN